MNIHISNRNGKIHILNSRISLKSGNKSYCLSITKDSATFSKVLIIRSPRNAKKNNNKYKNTHEV